MSEYGTSEKTTGLTICARQRLPFATGRGQALKARLSQYLDTIGHQLNLLASL